MKVIHLVTDCTAIRDEHQKVDNHAARCIARKLGVKSATIEETSCRGHRFVAGLNHVVRNQLTQVRVW